MVVKCEKFVKMCRLCCKNAICNKSIAIYIEIWYNNNKSFDIKTALIIFFTIQKFRGNYLKKRCKKSKNDTLVLKYSKTMVFIANKIFICIGELSILQTHIKNLSNFCISKQTPALCAQTHDFVVKNIQSKRKLKGRK